MGFMLMLKSILINKILKTGFFKGRKPSKNSIVKNTSHRITNKKKEKNIEQEAVSSITSEAFNYALDINNEGIVAGWIYSNLDTADVIGLDVFIDGDLVYHIAAESPRGDLTILGIEDCNHGFHIDVKEYTDKSKFYFSILETTSNISLLKNQLVIVNSIQQSNSTKVDNLYSNQLSDFGFVYSLDINRDGVVAGWIYNTDASTKAVEFELFLNNEFIQDIVANQYREDLHRLGLNNLKLGFNIDVNSYSSFPFYRFSIIEKSSQQPLIKNQTVFPTALKIQALLELQVFLKKNNYESYNFPLTSQTVNTLLPNIINTLRKRDVVFLDEQISLISVVEEVEDKYTVNVIIPVYKGIEETRNCILSTLQASNKIPFQLTVINDKSPEAKMYDMLEQLVQKYNFELLTNNDNLGFVKTVNIGMRSSNKDVILINSDTVVNDGWIDAIYHEAYETKESDSVGTVTPMSNNATICSFPRFCAVNELTDGFQLTYINEVCQTNVQPAIDLPTAHGYCMFIKRIVIDNVGYFDEQKWGMGYAEENDFSLRASNYGWRHVMTNKTFVHHLGSVSFAEDTEKFIQINLQKLNKLYPDYPVRVMNFIKEDPARFLRNELGEKLLVDESKGKVTAISSEDKGLNLLNSDKRSLLFINLTLGGGTQKAVDDLGNCLIREGKNAYILTAKQGIIWTLSSQVSNLEVVYHIDNKDEYKSLIQLLEDLGVWHIHYHHVIEFSKKVWDLPNDLKCEYDVTLHDFYTVCPRVNLITVNDVFCEQPSNNYCNNECLPELGVHASSYLNMTDFDNDINQWQYFYSSKLSDARKVFTPSEDTKKRILKKIYVKNIVAQYHPEPIESLLFDPPIHNKSILSIGFIGAIGVHKGLNRIKELVVHIADNQLSIEIVIFGYTSDDDFFSGFDFVVITGSYSSSYLIELLLTHPVDIVFLSSIWPETFSYTYSEILAYGLPIVSFDIGAVPERSKGQPNVLIIPVDLTVEEVLSRIESFLISLPKCRLEIGQCYDSLLSDYYGLGIIDE